jgi:hypothetical protein
MTDEQKFQDKLPRLMHHGKQWVPLDLLAPLFELIEAGQAMHDEGRCGAARMEEWEVKLDKFQASGNPRTER